MVVSTVGGIIPYWEFFITFKILSLSLLYEWPYLLFQELGRARAGGGEERAHFGSEQQTLIPGILRFCVGRFHVAILVLFTGNGYYRFSPSPVVGTQK